MKPNILAILLGAFCASAWWAFSFYHEFVPSLILPAIISSVGVIVWIIVESSEFKS